MSFKVAINTLMLFKLQLVHILLVVISYASANRCTDVLSRTEVHEVTYKEPCLEKYTARCGWVSLNYCTFYRDIFCDKKRNEMVMVYYIVSDCCDGYFLAKNGTCIKKSPGVEHETGHSLLIPVDPNYVESPLKQKKDIPVENLEITGGGYAGIACGVVLIACVATFTALGIRKRRLRYWHQKQIQSAQTSPMGPNMGKSKIVCTASYTRTPTVPPSQQVTLCSSSRTVTPSQSPAKYSVEKPLVSPDKMEAGNADVT